jgi:hypothetical protein
MKLWQQYGAGSGVEGRYFDKRVLFYFRIVDLLDEGLREGGVLTF